MAPIPLSFGASSNRGRVLYDNSATVENAYVELLGEGGKAQVAMYAAPGLRPWANLPTGPHRGARVVAGVMYVVSGQVLYAVNRNGTYRALGALPGYDQVRFAFNALAVPDIVIVSSGRVWHVKNGALTQFLSDALPPPVDVCLVRGRFVYAIADGRFYYSDINAMTVGGASFYNAEGAPDGLVGIWTRRSEVWLFGTETVEVWTPTGDSDDPFSRQGGGSRPYGAASAASVCEVNDRIFWIDNNASLRMAEGYDGVDIATPFVSRLLEAEVDPGSITASGYGLSGQYYVDIAGTGFSLRYSLETKQFTERKTHLRPRWRGVGATSFAGATIVGDDLTGDLYKLDPEYGYDGDEPIVMRLVTNIEHPWPNPLTVYSLHADIVSAVGQNTGDPVIDDPVAFLRMSEDGGRSWFGPIPERLGLSGEQRRIIWRQLGTWQRTGCSVELSIPAAVVRCVMSAVINGEAGVA